MDILEQLIKNRHFEYEVAINTSFGGFSLTKEMCEELHLEFKTQSYIFDKDRSNPILIELIKKHKPKDLEIIKIELEDIPRAYLRNYDGREEIIYRDDDMAYPLMDYLCQKNWAIKNYELNSRN